jgi:hypothetical protein
MRVISRFGFLAHVVPAKHPAGAAGDLGHVGTSLVEDQVKAGAQAVLALLEGRDAAVAARDLEGDGGGGKGFLECANENDRGLDTRCSD